MNEMHTHKHVFPDATEKSFVGMATGHVKFDKKGITLGHAEPVKLDARFMAANRLTTQATILSDMTKRFRGILIANADATLITFPKHEIQALVDNLEFIVAYSRDGAVQLIESVETKELFEREDE